MSESPVAIQDKPTVSPQEPRRKHRSPAYMQAIEIQELLRTSAKDGGISGVALASVARAWLELERLKREIRMKPKPKPVDVSDKARGRKALSFTEPVEPPNAG